MTAILLLAAWATASVVVSIIVCLSIHEATEEERRVEDEEQAQALAEEKARRWAKRQITGNT